MTLGVGMTRRLRSARPHGGTAIGLLASVGLGALVLWPGWAAAAGGTEAGPAVRGAVERIAMQPPAGSPASIRRVLQGLGAANYVLVFDVGGYVTRLLVLDAEAAPEDVEGSSGRAPAPATVDADLVRRVAAEIERWPALSVIERERVQLDIRRVAPPDVQARLILRLQHQLWWEHEDEYAD
jgi:hypothetical protein